MEMMAKRLDFEVQQIAVDLVVNIGIVLLLAQVQTWNVHGSLKTVTVLLSKVLICMFLNLPDAPYQLKLNR